METFNDIIDAWPSVIDFAKEMGVPYPTACAWRQRDRIPAPHWNTLIAAARARRIRGVNTQLLADLAERVIAA